MERRQLNFSRAERLARLSNGAISKPARQRSAPTLTVYLGLARAFKMQPEDVLRQAGILDPVCEPLDGEILGLLRALLPKRRKLIVLLLQALREEEENS